MKSEHEVIMELYRLMQDIYNIEERIMSLKKCCGEMTQELVKREIDNNTYRHKR